MRVLLSLLLVLAGTSAAFAQSLEDRRAATQGTLANARACRQLGEVYWEIGDASGRLAWGQRGTAFRADKPIRIASASKWLWGAAVVERRGGVLNAADIAALTMSSGYDGLNPLRCRGRVTDCLTGPPDPSRIGRFVYDGAHAQAQAVALGLGGLDGPGLAAEMQRWLGGRLDFTFRSPQPAGGALITPAAYGRFLTRLVAGKLKLSGLLGSHAVCTLPGQCPTAVKSPAAPHAWHYRLHHWVEDGPLGDGAFSSAGAFGFYPWIAADRSHWGVLAREVIERRAGMDSAACGALLRKAWSTAQQQE